MSCTSIGLAVFIFCGLLLCISADYCGYQSCPYSPQNMINVHLVPHSHDDVGWLKTVDQYYYGSKTKIQRAGVQNILDNVIAELMKDSKRRFIYAESAFLFKWYNEQSVEVQKSVRKLIGKGRLEIVGGAWSMNDEAAVHYQSVIDQFTLGIKKLTETFGKCGRPRVGWQIDPFGHSREQASLFAQMAFDGQFFARMDYIDKETRFNNLTAEMVWHASDSLSSESADLFTGLLYNHYSSPPGFCFDTLCTDDPIIDGNSTENNVKERVDDFISYIHKLAKLYRSTNVMVPMGDDFAYENAGMNFKNMDKLIKYVNQRQKSGSKINIIYSTPSCYLRSLHKSMLTWPNKTQDFFPYSSDWQTFWAGYYSSRPTQKRFERIGNHFLQVSKQLTALANLTGPEVATNLNKLREAMGIMQHHDAVTGTEKQHVASDYNRILHEGLKAAQVNTKMALRKLTNLTNGEFESCLSLNISVCEISNRTKEFIVTIFNPLAHVSTQFVRVPVQEGIYTVTNTKGEIIPFQIVPVPKPVMDLSFRQSTTNFEIVFKARVSKVATFYVKSKDTVAKPITQIKIPQRFLSLNGTEPKVYTTVENSHVKLTFSSLGHLINIQVNGTQDNITQDFFYYKGAGADGNNRRSGAYIFRPNGTEIPIATKVKLTVIEGPIVKEVHQVFSDWISQVIRIYEGSSLVEFEWIVGPIPVDDKIGKEVITRFTSNIRNNGVFYTDSNGREMLKRVRNQREDFKPNMTEAISGNYYPVTARIALQDEQKRLALLNDRAQGGSSIHDGSLEVMLHRRLLYDDYFGVGEALNETQYGKGLVARGKLYLQLGATKEDPTITERMAQLEILLPFWKFFSTTQNSGAAKLPIVPKLPDFSILPPAVHLVTYEQWNDKEVLIRFENYFDNTETSTVWFNIRPIFNAIGGTEIRETTLDGSMPLGEMRRMKFIVDGTRASEKVKYITTGHVPLLATKWDRDSKFNLTLNPMQIRTFIVKQNKKIN